LLDNIHLGLKAILPSLDPRWPSYSESEVTIGSSQGGWVAGSSIFVPSQTSDGIWRLKFNLTGTYTAATINALTVTISGVTCPANGQSGNGYISGTGAVTSSKAVAIGATTCNVSWIGTSSGNTTSTAMSGDIEITSKPTWADKVAPDLYVANTTSSESGDWVDYTPITQGLGTVTLDNVQWRRDGPDLKVRGYLTTGTGTAVEAQIGLPSGLTIDSVGSNVVLSGNCGRATNSSATWGILATDGDTYVNIGQNISGSSSILVPILGTAVGNAARISFNFKVPIDGWTWVGFFQSRALYYSAATYDGQKRTCKTSKLIVGRQHQLTQT